MGTADDPRWLKESRRQLKRRQQRRPPQPGASLFRAAAAVIRHKAGFPPQGEINQSGTAKGHAFRLLRAGALFFAKEQDL